MAIGNPFLATYAEDALVRTYEYVGGVFVPLGVSAPYEHTPGEPSLSVGADNPFMGWLNNDDFILLIRALDNTQNTMVALGPSGEEIDDLTPFSPTFGAGGVWGQSDPLTQLVYTRYPAFNFSQLNGWSVSSSGTPQNLGANTPSLNAGANHTDFHISPSGKFAVACGVDVKPQMITRTSLVAYPPTFGAQQLLNAIQFNASLVRFTDDYTVAALAKGGRTAHVYRHNGTGGLTKLQDLPMPADVNQLIKDAKSSPDQRHLAVSFSDGMTTYTRVFKRASGYLVLLQEIAGFGRDLAWSIDGKMIVDAPSRKAVKMNPATGQFTNHDSAMVNVAEDIRFSVMSRAPTDKSAVPSVYLAALEPFATCGIDWDNLKFTLLTSSAVFDDTDASFADFTNGGAWEVTAAAWPTGGLPITNVTEGMGTTSYEFKCDDLTWLTFGTSMAWRYGVIYDATNDIPLICFDYFGEREVATNREVFFEFPEDVFLRLVK